MLNKPIELQVVEHADGLLTVVGRCAHPHHVGQQLLIDVHAWLRPLVAELKELPDFLQVVLLSVAVYQRRERDMVKYQTVLLFHVLNKMLCFLGLALVYVSEHDGVESMDGRQNLVNLRGFGLKLKDFIELAFLCMGQHQLRIAVIGRLNLEAQHLLEGLERLFGLALLRENLEVLAEVALCVRSILEKCLEIALHVFHEPGRIGERLTLHFRLN